MKILLIIPGHLKTVPMNRFTEKALIELGHSVHVESYHPNLIEKILGKICVKLNRKEVHFFTNLRIRKKIKQFSPNLLFTIYGFDLSEKTLSFARTCGVKTACWWINDPFQFDRGLSIAKNYDVWFSNSAESANQMKRLTGIKSYFLPTACEPSVHSPAKFDSSIACDICFAGDWSKERENLMLFLLNSSFKIHIYGPWEKKIPKDSKLHSFLTSGFFTPEQMADYFSSSKIVLNYHTWYGKFSHGVNPRLFEAAGCRTVQVTDYKEEMSTLFDLESELITYKSIDELPYLLNKLLEDDVKRDQLASSSYNRVIRDHTYLVRMQQMLDLVFK